MKKITLLFIVLFYFGFLPQGIGQKRISGRSGICAVQYG